MKMTSMSTPGINLTMTDFAIAAVTIPIAMVAIAPIERRAIIIGNVNVIALATLAYAGHDTRMMKPATVATITHTPSPATTPTMFFVIPPPLERSVATEPSERSDHAPIVGPEV
jgi:hypothetical protein